MELDDFMSDLDKKIEFVCGEVLVKTGNLEIYKMLIDIMELVVKFDCQRKYTEKS